MTTLRRTIDDVARRAIAARTEALFRSSGALREGHFVLKSGRHSDAYLEKFQVLQDPAATSELCGFWAAAHRDECPTPVDAMGGSTHVLGGPGRARTHTLRPPSAKGGRAS